MSQDSRGETSDVHNVNLSVGSVRRDGLDLLLVAVVDVGFVQLTRRDLAVDKNSSSRSVDVASQSQLSVMQMGEREGETYVWMRTAFCCLLSRRP